MLRMQVEPPEVAGFGHEFSGDSLIVGRAPDCGLVVVDPFLSRHHARFFLHDGALLVEDLGSSNGTILNGHRIASATAVSVGDVLMLSGTRLTILELELDGAPLAPQSEDGEGAGITVLRPVAELIQEAPEADSPASLRRYAERLRWLNDLHRGLSRTVEIDELFELVLDGAFEHLAPEEAVLLVKDDDGELRTVASRTSPGTRTDRLVSQTLIREVVEKGQAAIAVDAQSDERFAGAESIIASGAKSLVAAPLMDGEDCLGMIALYSRLLQRAFSEEDMQLLASLASVAALRIRNLALTHAEAERERMAAELKSARRLQESLLPKSLPELDGYEIFGFNTPSQGVSGDYYQVVERPEREDCVLLVADVCGKGMAASLLTATLEAVCSALIAAGVEPEHLLSRACTFLYQRTPPDKFATAVMAVARPQGRVLFANAGHNPPLLLRAGSSEVEELPATGFPLGMLPQADYEIRELELAPGDLLVMFTDGIVEASNPEGEDFELERLTELLLAARERPLAEIWDDLEAALNAFAAGRPFADDRTVLMVRRS